MSVLMKTSTSCFDDDDEDEERDNEVAKNKASLMMIIQGTGNRMFYLMHVRSIFNSILSSSIYLKETLISLDTVLGSEQCIRR
jgi:hypothetical protein